MERNENIKCRRWILGHFLIASLMLAVVATFNYRVDSLGLFHPDKGLRYAMRNVLEGRMVAGLIYLSPFHPVAYEGIKEKFPMVLGAEDYLRDFASKQNILLMGSYDPAKYNFENKDFIDGSHGNEKVAKKIFEGFPL